MREDIENLNFNELNDLEKQEYVAVITHNLRRLCLQLMNSGDTQLAGLFTMATNIALISPDKFQSLTQYTFKLYQTMILEQDMHRRTQALADDVAKDGAKDGVQDDFPPLDSDKEQ